MSGRLLELGEAIEEYIRLIGEGWRQLDWGDRAEGDHTGQAVYARGRVLVLLGAWFQSENIIQLCIKDSE